MWKNLRNHCEPAQNKQAGAAIIIRRLNILIRRGNSSYLQHDEIVAQTCFFV